MKKSGRKKQRHPRLHGSQIGLTCTYWISFALDSFGLSPLSPTGTELRALWSYFSRWAEGNFASISFVPGDRMYVCMHVCMYVCMHVRTYTCMRVCIAMTIINYTCMPQTQPAHISCGPWFDGTGLRRRPDLSGCGGDARAVET